MNETLPGNVRSGNRRYYRPSDGFRSRSAIGVAMMGNASTVRWQDWQLEMLAVQ
jgi:hypothetical protein